MVHQRRYLIALIASLTMATACVSGGGQGRPDLKAPEGSTAYALSLAQDIDTATAAWEQDKTRFEDTLKAFETYPKALSENPWEVAARLMDLSDEAGRRGDIVALYEERAQIERFYQAHDKDLVRRLNANVQAAARKKSCQCELEAAGAIRYALDEGMSKAMDANLEARHDAHLLLDQQTQTVGKRNLKPLREHINAVTWASAYAHVLAPGHRTHLRNLLQTAQDAQDTLKDAIEQEEARLQATPKPPRHAQKAIKARLENLKAQQQALQTTLTIKRPYLAEDDPTIDNIKERYEEAHQTLIKALEAKIQ